MVWLVAHLLGNSHTLSHFPRFSPDSAAYCTTVHHVYIASCSVCIDIYLLKFMKKRKYVSSSARGAQGLHITRPLSFLLLSPHRTLLEMGRHLWVLEGSSRAVIPQGPRPTCLARPPRRPAQRRRAEAPRASLHGCSAWPALRPSGAVEQPRPTMRSVPAEGRESHPWCGVRGGCSLGRCYDRAPGLWGDVHPTTVAPL